MRITRNEFNEKIVSIDPLETEELEKTDFIIDIEEEHAIIKIDDCYFFLKFEEFESINLNVEGCNDDK